MRLRVCYNQGVETRHFCFNRNEAKQVHTPLSMAKYPAYARRVSTTRLPCRQGTLLVFLEVDMVKSKGIIIHDPIERFWSRVEKQETGCWIWQGLREATKAQPNAVYGRFPVNNSKVRAHRFSYELTKGVIPKGFVIDHLCRNTLCVNPDHLEAVTLQENIRRGLLGVLRPQRTHCSRGHELTPENTWLRKDRGRYNCLTCRRERTYRWRQEHILKYRQLDAARRKQKRAMMYGTADITKREDAA